MENASSPQQQPRRSQRRRQQADRLQLNDVRRAERRPLPYRRMRRERLQQLQQQQQQQPALEERSQTEIITDFGKYSKRDKATPESTFMTKIGPRLSFLFLALFFGCLTEFSSFFMEEEAFLFQMLEFNRLHSVFLPFRHDVTSVLSVFTHNFLKPCANPFLFRLTNDSSVYALTYFLRRYFKSALLSDELLIRLALICWPPCASLNPGFIVGTIKSYLSSAEIMTSEAEYFCFKCVQCFKSEKELLSHCGKTHNWLLNTELTEENVDACAKKYHDINISKWPTHQALRNLVADTMGANRYFAQWSQLLITPYHEGQPAPNADPALLATDGWTWRGVYAENLPNPFYPAHNPNQHE